MLETQKQRNDYTETISKHANQINQLEEKLSSERKKEDASKDIQQNILKQINELNVKIASEKKKYKAIKNELQESRALNQADKLKLKEAEKQIERIQKQSQEETDRLATAKAKLEKLELEKNSQKSIKEKQATVNQMKSDILRNSNFNANAKEAMIYITKLILNYAVDSFFQYYWG